MNFQFSNPLYLLLLPPAVVWVIWLAWKSDVQISLWRRWAAFLIRLMIVVAVILAVAGLQWKQSMEGLNVFFLLDRSDSVPSPQQEAAREMVNKFASQKKLVDKAGVLVFGGEASIESSVTNAVDVKKIYSVIPTERSDISAAIRLGTAAFPENGQRRLVLFSDGNENSGNALDALLAAKPLGVSIDVVPLGINRGNDVSVQKLTVPSTVKKGQTFDVKIFANADAAQSATIRLYRNEQFLGEQKVELVAGKNLFTFPQTLTDPGFYSYNLQLDAPGDLVPQNNRASSFTSVRGNPRILIISAEPQQDATLGAALQDSKLDVKVTDVNHFPGSLAEMQSYDTIFLSNIPAGDLGEANMKLLESAVRDFGVGLVCVGGDQTYAAGGYRNTPLEAALPVDMELNSKKVLPSGALVIVCHATEFPNGNQWARDIAFAALDALGPQDQMGIVLWDGNNRWLFPLDKVGDKKEMGRKITGMNPGDMMDFGGPMQMAHEALKKSTANLKHMVVFSDGDPSAPSKKSVEEIVGDKITITTVMIGGHVTPETMTWMADMGRGRFYDVRSPAQLPQIFVKEAAIILKSAIFEQPFKPQIAAGSELVRGIAAADYPTLKGYVCTTPKPRAEVPLVSDKGDPVLAHWQYGLGRSVAFTSDAKAKWAADWMGWDKYRQFWSQVAQWSLRKIENADFTTEVSVEKGEGHISVEAVDNQGNYRNFLNLQTTVVSPKGEKQVVRLEQTGPGHYEVNFPTREVGSYLLNLADTKDGQVRATQVLGASVNYSPEFSATEPNLHLFRKLTESGEGKILEPEVDNPFLHDRKKTFQPRDLWEWLLRLAILLFPLDVAVRRVQLDRDEMARFFRKLQFWKKEKKVTQDESLSALLARRDEVRAKQTSPVQEVDPDLFKPRSPVIISTASKEAPKPQSISDEAVKAGDRKEAQPTSTTSRLLDAKKRAKKNLE
jgi:uncharacterized membrane protein